jgi:hypothetical protein
MIDPPFSSGDSLEQFLKTRVSSDTAEPLRQALLQQTLHRLRRRQRAKRLATVAALAACYAAGLVTMRLWMQPATRPAPQFVLHQHSENTLEAPPRETARPHPSDAVPVAPLQETEAEASPLVLERLAAASKTRRAQLYREAGDRYLENQGDMQGALRCYALALEAAPDAELSISAKDSWLLMALKKARLEEKDHGKNGG